MHEVRSRGRYWLRNRGQTDAWTDWVADWDTWVVKVVVAGAHLYSEFNFGSLVTMFVGLKAERFCLWRGERRNKTVEKYSTIHTVGRHNETVVHYCMIHTVERHNETIVKYSMIHTVERHNETVVKYSMINTVERRNETVCKVQYDS
jgi:uncharacterized protein YlbG (UPF0298 family)